MKLLVFIVFITLLLASCADNTAQHTLEANHAQAGTAVANLRITATVQSARARTTIDMVQTRAAAAATQSQFLEATLASYGTPPEVLQFFHEQVLGSRPTPSPTLTLLADALPGSTASPAPVLTATPLRETLTPTMPIITPYATRSVATAITTPFDPAAPRLENPVTAASVGSDDCAAQITALFTPASPAIYVVAEAVNIGPGSVIAARWLRAGTQVGPVYEFAPDFDIERACVWIFVDQSDFEFTAGQYTVELLLNGLPASPALNFTIVPQ